MCLAIPGRLVDVSLEQGMLFGRVDFGGVAKRICLELLPDARPGEYLLVHVGFALARIDEAEAARIFEILGSEALSELERGGV